MQPITLKRAKQHHIARLEKSDSERTLLNLNNSVNDGRQQRHDNPKQRKNELQLTLKACKQYFVFGGFRSAINLLMRANHLHADCL